MQSLIKITITAVLIMFLSSCIVLPALLISGVASGALLKNIQESQMRSNTDDLIITHRIKNKMKKVRDFAYVNINTYRGVVLITGNVKNTENVIAVLKIILGIDGIKYVINDIHIRDEEPSIIDSAKSALIMAKIKAELLLNKKIKFSHFLLDVCGKDVYIIGESKSQPEINAIFKIIRKYTSGKIFNYINIEQFKSKTDNNLIPKHNQPHFTESGITPEQKCLDNDNSHFRKNEKYYNFNKKDKKIAEHNKFNTDNKVEINNVLKKEKYIINKLNLYKKIIQVNK